MQFNFKKPQNVPYLKQLSTVSANVAQDLNPHLTNPSHSQKETSFSRPPRNVEALVNKLSAPHDKHKSQHKLYDSLAAPSRFNDYSQSSVSVSEDERPYGNNVPTRPPAFRGAAPKNFPEAPKFSLTQDATRSGEPRSSFLMHGLEPPPDFDLTSSVSS